MVESTFNYENFVVEILNQLKIVATININTNYLFAHEFLSLKIVNDMTAKVYIELKKNKKSDITLYPLVIFYNHSPIEIDISMLDRLELLLFIICSHIIKALSYVFIVFGIFKFEHKFYIISLSVCFDIYVWYFIFASSFIYNAHDEL